MVVGGGGVGVGARGPADPRTADQTPGGSPRGLISLSFSF